jgi:NAD(P)-dependent dehydrogenase (short-subunit alcohol dehydrogenase family)
MTQADRHDRVAVITGAGTGIGKAVSLALSRAGYRVALTGRNAARLDAVVAATGAGPEHAIALAAEVGDPAAVKRLFVAVARAWGRIDLLFNNAGSGAPAVPMEELSYEQWRSVLDANLTGSFLCAQEAIRMMKAQTPRGGRIINNGSISAHAPRPNSAPYTATKHAITGLTRSIALDGREWSIACGQIDIGNAATEMTEPMARGIRQANGSTLVEPRIDPVHVADAVLYMAGLPLEANVLSMTVMATHMPFVGRG